MTTDQDSVLAYLRKNPGSHARDVAREVFGGTGELHTWSRNKAYKILNELKELGAAVRKRPDGAYSKGNSDRWQATETNQN